MKKLAGFLTVLVLLQCGLAFAQSDRDAIETYKNKRQSLMESIKTAQDAGQLTTLDSAINNLQAEYTEYKEVLDDALHPESFDTSIAALRDQLKISTVRISAIRRGDEAEGKVGVLTGQADEDAETIAEIRRQNAKYQPLLEKLTAEVKKLGNDIQTLTEENAGLLGQVRALQSENKNDKESIAKLKELTEKLTKNIQDRDDLIIKMMDSFVSDYSKGGLTDTQQKNLFVSTQGNDYVGKIISTVDENVKYAENTLLSPQDVELIKAEQRKLAVKWDAIKPYVGKLYLDEQIKTRDLAEVDSRLSDWKKGIDETTWKSIHQVFIGQNVDIGAFRTAEEFRARLLAYIDEQVKNPSRDKYQLFKNKVWDSPIKDQWLAVIPTDELTVQQRVDIDERIALWGKKVSALRWRWVLIGVFGIAVIVVIVVLILRKKRPLPPMDEDKTGSNKNPTS